MSLDTLRRIARASAQPGLRAPPPDRLVDAKAIDMEGVRRWVVAICKPATERAVGDDLTRLGFRSYCPLGRRVVYRGRGQGSSRKRRIHQWSVFGRYLFVGEVHEPLAAFAHGCIVDVIGDRYGAWPLDPRVILEINKAEIDGRWDLSNIRAWEGHFNRGDHVTITEGPLTALKGIVLQCSKAGIKVEMDMFGRKSATTFKPRALVMA